jgi:hypothetical protein
MNMPDDELELRRRLRQLPRERAPTRDLWPQIETRVAGTRSMLDARPRRSVHPGWALAASLLLVLVLASDLGSPVVSMHDDTPRSASARSSSGAELVRRQAEAIAIEYRLALAPFAASRMSATMEQAATELDVSATELLAALRQQPDATYLLERLRRTYDQRLKLAQRAELG